MNERELAKIEKSLNKLDLLEDFNWKHDTRAIVSGFTETLDGGKFWSAKKICSYNVRPGMLPGTAGIDPDDADKDELRRLSFDFRRSIAGKVLGFFSGQVNNSWRNTLTQIDHSTTELFVNKRCTLVVQTVWTWFYLGLGPEKNGRLEASFFVTSREFY